MRSASFLLAGVVLLLGGCPSNEQETTPVTPALSGTGNSGFSNVTDFSVRAQAGTPRSLSLSSDDDGPYRLPVGDLLGPYLVRGSVAATNDVFHALALGPGAANVTPLTELVAAAALADVPRLFYDGLAGGLSRFGSLGTADLQRAEERVRVLLQRRFGIAVPAALASFNTSAYAAVPGDPMHETIRALRRRLVEQGRILADLTGDVVADTLLCRGEGLALAEGGDDDALCPSAKTHRPDADDAAVSVIGFDNVYGERLELRVRDNALLSVSFVRRGGTPATCEGAACVGVTLETPAADGTRGIRFEGTPLAGANGTVRLQGHLVSGNGAVPALCAGTRVTAIATSGAIDVHCVARRITTSKFSRTSYAFFSKSSSNWLLNVIAGPDGVHWVSISDPTRLDNDRRGVRYRCKDNECNGVAIGAPDASGARRLVLAGTVLQGIGEGGNPDPADSVAVSAELDGAALSESPPAACDVPLSPTLANSDGVTIGLCPSTAFINPNAEDLDGDGVVDVVSLDYLDDRGNTTITLLQFDLATGASAAVEVRRRFINDAGLASRQTVQYRCSAEACAGVAVQASFESVQVQFSGTVLQEVDPDGSPGSRTLTLNGSLP